MVRMVLSKRTSLLLLVFVSNSPIVGTLKLTKLLVHFYFLFTFISCSLLFPVYFYFLFTFISCLLLIGVESDTDGTNTDASDVPSLDSDLEREQEKSYVRLISKEEISVIKKKLKKDESGKTGGRSGRKQTAPDTALTLEFVHGYGTRCTCVCELHD